MRALHPLDQHAHPLGLLERERVALGQLGHEAQHREVGVAVQEHVLDELLRREAVDRIGVAARALREAARGPAPSTGRRCAATCPPGSTMWVWTSKMNSSPASASRRPRSRTPPPRAGRSAPPVLPRAANAWLRVSSVVAAPHSDCRNARRGTPDAPGVGGDPLARQRIGRGHGPGQRHRPELAIRGRIDLDRKSTVRHVIVPPARLYG